MISYQHRGYSIYKGQLEKVGLSLLFCLITLLEGICQQSDPVVDIKFEQISEGLSQNTVTSILQDSKGFMWVGTRNGLNRYDGVEFTTYTNIFGDSTSISHSHINSMMEDSEGNLWIGTWEGGLNLYDRERDIFHHFKYDGTNKGLSDNSVYAIYEDSNGILWIGTENGGLNKFDKSSGTFEYFQHDPSDASSISSNNVRIIFEDEYRNLWVGTFGGGLDRFDQGLRQFIHYRHDENDPGSLTGDVVWKYIIDQEKRIWLGTTTGLNLMRNENGLVYFERFQHELNEPNSLPHNTIRSLSEDDYGRIWVGTENGGLSVFDYEKNTYINLFPDPLDPVSIGSNSIWSIFKDNTGAMWLGARNRGLNKWDVYQQKFNHRMISPSGDNSLSNKDVVCFLEDREGNLWIGTDGGGLNYYDKKTKKFVHYIHDPNDNRSLGSNSVISLLEDSEGNMWVGTWEGGLNYFDKNTRTFRRYLHDAKDPKSIMTNNIFTMVEDKQGRMWIGTFYGGIDLFDKEKNTFTHIKPEHNNPASLTSNRVFQMVEDSQGRIWIGYSGGGISVMTYDESSGPSFEHYKYDPVNSSSLSSNVIHSIIEDHDQNIWIGTLAGLNKFDPVTKTFKIYREKDGLPDNAVQGILEDDEGNLWISTNQGLSKFDPTIESFRNYNIADGLQAQEFIRSSCMKSNSGELFFGGVNGFNSFYPSNIIDNPYIPPVYITGFRIYNELIRPGDVDSPLTTHISDTEEITLSYNQNEFSFEFTALNYSQASKNNYSYILEGYDRDWHEVGTQRNANYARVPHGKYTFRVRGTNNDGIWNTEGASLLIVITPPWWDTWWAYIIYGFIAGGLFLWYRQNLINKERLKSDLKLEHMELTKMQELDEMKSHFYANISHEFRTPLTLILSPLKLMYNDNFKGDIKKQYQVMIRNGERLLRLINQLLDLSKLGSGKMELKTMRMDLIHFLKPIVASFDSYMINKSLVCEFNYPNTPVMVYFDQDKLEKIVTNLISNAFKYTEQGKISIDVKLLPQGQSTQNLNVEADHVVISIRDTGIGITQDAISHIFDRFYQAEQNQMLANEGTGIGLSLTKNLVELHHGKILVESKEGVGSTFKVFLPLGKDHLDESDIVVQDDVKTKRLQNLSTTDHVEFDEEVSEPENKLASLGTDQEKSVLPRLLIIEDNDDMRKYICDHMREFYSISEAANGAKGLEIALEIVPDLIISDIMMPEMDGVELCAAIKKDPLTSHIPVVLLTAKADVEDRIQGLDTGADDYITKPFDSRILLIRSRNLIQIRRLLHEKFKGGGLLEIEPSEITTTSLDEEFINRILEVIENNMANSEFRVEDLSREVAMSRMHLYRKIKALTGQSIVEFIRTIRLKRAAQLLKQGQLTVSEVTYDVGFNDLQYFRNCFKKQFGVSPSQYASNPKVGG